MPFLLAFLNQIKHESALQILSRQQDQQNIPLPFEAMTQSLLNSGKRSIHMRDTVDIYGRSGSGKTLILSSIAFHAVEHGGDVICIDMDGRFEPPSLGSEHFFLFGATADCLSETLLGLEQWLLDCSDKRVVWLIIDGAAINDIAWHRLKTMQAKWGFAILTASHPSLDRNEYHATNARWNIRYELFKENSRIKMRLASSQQEAFIVI